MRVVVLGPAYPFRGGIAHYTTLLARHLALRHEVRLLSFTRQYPARLFPGRTDRDPSRAAVDGGALRLLDPLRPWTWWRAAASAAEVRPDLVIVQWWVPFWAPSLATFAALVRRWSGARVVFVCHNVLPHDGAGWLDRAAARLALGRGDAFIVHSAPDEAALRRLLPALPAGAVHRALLPIHTIAAPVDRVEARRQLGLPADGRVALFFGFVRPYKGLEHLVEALPAATGAVPGLQLVVAGEFWRPAADFTARARDLGVADALRIDDRYVPNEEVGAYFAAADVVVLPYVEATQSGVVTLAVQFGRPVIATAVGGLPEVVVDGVTGIVVPPGDPRVLADALVRFFSEPGLAERLGEGVHATRDRFGWEALVELVERIGTTLTTEGAEDAKAS